MRAFAGLAHLVEHLTCNQGVVGSSPATGTKYKKAQFLNWAFSMSICIKSNNNKIRRSQDRMDCRSHQSKSHRRSCSIAICIITEHTCGSVIANKIITVYRTTCCMAQKLAVAKAPKAVNLVKMAFSS